jgi:hypothetical protein
MAELRAQVALWSILRELPISDASEKQFCHWPGFHGWQPVVLQPIEECIAAGKEVWSQWSAGCEALAHASAWDPDRMDEIVPLPGYPQLPSARLSRVRRDGIFKPEIMWFLEFFHARPELPFAWEFRDGVPLPLPFPPRPSRDQWPD